MPTFPEEWDFAAKVRWRMLYDRNGLHPLLLDKVAVKEYASARGVDSARTLHVTRNPDTIPHGTLPKTCFLKANHASGWNFLRLDGEWHFFGHGKRLMGKDGRPLTGSERREFRLTETEMRDRCRRMLTERYSRMEWAYHRIIPRILVEETLSPWPSGELMDYRFYSFDGTVRAVSVGSPTYRREGRNVFLTPDWKVIPLSRYAEALPDPLPEKPVRLEEMIHAACRLGDGIDFVRIDLYETAEGVRLGEMTLYPEGGDRNTPTSCPRFNYWLGALWRGPNLSR